MGLDINTALLLDRWVLEHQITGPLLMLGVQQLDFTWSRFCTATGRQGGQTEADRIPGAQELMLACGIGETFSLDISGHEGADFIFDLNNDFPPSHLLSRFGAVLNGGTIEHVFNIPNALTAITRMLRVGGFVIHVAPVHNWIDHGFYQINPTLLFDYYTAAGYEIIESAGLVFTPGTDAACDIIPVVPGALGGGDRAAFGDRAVLSMFAARKTAGSVDKVTPTQSFYAAEPVHPPPSLRWFPPFSVTRGISSGGACERWVLGPFTPEEGRAWTAALPVEFPGGDTMETPGRSRLTLFENDRLLGPAHATHAIVRARGGGSYSHWQGALLFSSSDDSDPNHNGRTYTAVLPQRSD